MLDMIEMIKDQIYY